MRILLNLLICVSGCVMSHHLSLMSEMKFSKEPKTTKIARFISEHPPRSISLACTILLAQMTSKHWTTTEINTRLKRFSFFKTENRNFLLAIPTICKKKHTFFLSFCFESFQFVSFYSFYFDKASNQKNIENRFVTFFYIFKSYALTIIIIIIQFKKKERKSAKKFEKKVNSLCIECHPLRLYFGLIEKKTKKLMRNYFKLNQFTPIRIKYFYLGMKK